MRKLLLLPFVALAVACESATQPQSTPDDLVPAPRFAREVSTAAFPFVKYFNGFDEQGTWVDGTYMHLQESLSRVVWNTLASAGFDRTYDALTLVVEPGDVIEFESRYFSHSDGNTRQRVQYGFADEITTTPLPTPGNNVPPISDNFLGAWYNNSRWQAGTDVRAGFEIRKDGIQVWKVEEKVRYPRVYKVRYAVEENGHVQATVHSNGVLWQNVLVEEDITGLPVSYAAAWNVCATYHCTQFGLEGQYFGQLHYVSWTGHVSFAGLIAKVEGLGLEKGPENSLVQKVISAGAAYDRGDYEAAVNILEAFISEVNAKEGKTIAPEDAQMLRTYAEGLIAGIQASM